MGAHCIGVEVPAGLHIDCIHEGRGGQAFRKFGTTGLTLATGGADTTVLHPPRSNKAGSVRTNASQNGCVSRISFTGLLLVVLGLAVA
jgi:hypothetical protein